MERSPTILLVEDDHSLRRYLEVMLERAGFTIITATDGLEAIKVVLKSTVDAVVTDAVMPHLSGHELCRFLRRHPNLSGLPIILLSGLDNHEPPPQEADCADIYLSKPVPPEELTRCLRDLLSRSPSTKQIPASGLKPKA